MLLPEKYLSKDTVFPYKLWMEVVISTALGSHIFVGPYLGEMELRMARKNGLQLSHYPATGNRTSLIHSLILNETVIIPKMNFFFPLTTKRKFGE